MVIAGAVAVVGLLTWARRARAAFAPPEGDALDALADMLIAETGFARGRDEMAQVVFVALNRATLYRKPVAEVVDPDGRAPAWNPGALYRERFDAARQNPRWSDARAFAAAVSRYRNLGATKFVHPGAMPAPPCGAGRVEMSTDWGVRCLPEWIAGATQVGGALFA